MDDVGALRLSPLRRGLAIDSTVDIVTLYVPHRHVYGEQGIKFMKDGVNATHLATVNTTGYIVHAFFFQAEDGIRNVAVTGVQPCALPISMRSMISWIRRPASSAFSTRSAGSPSSLSRVRCARTAVSGLLISWAAAAARSATARSRIV